jgi:hypothetical protein
MDNIDAIGRVAKSLLFSFCVGTGLLRSGRDARMLGMDAISTDHHSGDAFDTWTKWSPDIGQSLTDLARNLSLLPVEQCHIVLIRHDFSIAKQLLLSEGNKHSTIIDYSRIVRLSLKNEAQYLFILHNHPSGDATPSEQDVRATFQLETYCRTLGIMMLDHFIISSNQCFSFRKDGRWPIADEDILSLLPVSAPAKRILGLLIRTAQPLAIEDLHRIDGLKATVAARGVVELAECGLVAGMPDHGDLAAIRLTLEGVKACAHPNSTYLF